MSARNACPVHISNQSDSQPGMYAQYILIITLILKPEFLLLLLIAFI